MHNLLGDARKKVPKRHRDGGLRQASGILWKGEEGAVRGVALGLRSCEGNSWYSALVRIGLREATRKKALRIVPI